MQYVVNIFFIGLISSSLLSCNPKSNNMLTVKGTIGNKFHFSTSSHIIGDEREELLKGIEVYSDKMDKLEQYFAYINEGKEEEAKKLIQADSVFSKTNEFGLYAGYFLTEMKALNVLFLPLIQSNSLEYAHLIVITEEELKLLDDYLNQEKEVELVIEQIGHFKSDLSVIYKLKKIKPSE